MGKQHKQEIQKEETQMVNKHLKICKQIIIIIKITLFGAY